ncbi:DUF5590 domain-containing protein [Weissella halotolerans]|nr:DUF5590 domain-containing protein [Weissella halotolerans]
MELRQTPQLKRRQKKFRTTLFLGLCLLVLAVGALGYARAVHPLSQAQSELVNRARRAGKIDQVDQFYHVAREKTFTAVTGRNHQQKPVAVIAESGRKKLVTVRLDKGKSAKSIQQQVQADYHPKKITTFGLGIYKGIVVWEVTFIDQADNLTFLAYQFSNGELIRSIQNL